MTIDDQLILSILKRVEKDEVITTSTRYMINCFSFLVTSELTIDLYDNISTQLIKVEHSKVGIE